MRARDIVFASSGALIGGACAQSVAGQTILQAADLQSDGTSFDRNEIVDAASFIDATGIDAAEVQHFLEATPYGHATFLATYQSNGVLASDAIVRAATKYKLNPLVFLVRAEMVQGLVGEQFYPAPPSRVEYVFQCGCSGGGACAPALAGFDVQVDCLGNALRTSLDEIAQSGATSGGWGPGNTSLSTEGEAITPADASTAALYQYMPTVGVGSGGNWLFRNVWNEYATFANYFGPISAPSMATAWVGDACTSDSACAYDGAVCATNYPGGMCTASCTSGCPSSAGRAPTFCGDFQQSGYCLVECNPTAPAACRAGYACKSVHNFGDAGASQYACVNQ